MSLIKCFLIVPVTDGSDGRWKRADGTGEPFRMGWAPVGAMWFADWYMNDETPSRSRFHWDNQFTPPLIVSTPGGDWDVDSRANNCTLPNDRLHRCWCRHGEPPNITVDKNGLTCAAGAGSILCGSYHGFLRDGFLTDC
jgi:hypothetical protein